MIRQVCFLCLILMNKSSREVGKDIRERKAQNGKLTRANCTEGLSDLCKEELFARGLTVRCPVLNNVDLTWRTCFHDIVPPPRASLDPGAWKRRWTHPWRSRRIHTAYNSYTKWWVHVIRCLCLTRILIQNDYNLIITWPERLSFRFNHRTNSQVAISASLYRAA